MAASGLASIADAGAARGPPTVPARWALVLLGLAAAATSFTLALLSEDVSGTLGEPLLIAALTAWVTLSYVVCGLVAWWRRPANRFGPLLIVAGFVNFLSTLSWSSQDVLHTLGQTLDLVPPVLFLHVFLAFPDGRLKGRFVRSFVATAYVVAITLELVRMSAGDYGPHNLLHLYSNARVEDAAWKVQLLTVSACCLAGVAVLGVRRTPRGQAASTLGRIARRRLWPGTGVDRVSLRVGGFRWAGRGSDPLGRLHRAGACADRLPDRPPASAARPVGSG